MTRFNATNKKGKTQAKTERTGVRPSWLEAGIGLALRFKRFSWDVGGIFLLAAACITLFALIGTYSGAWESGAWVIPWVNFLTGLFGSWGTVFVVLGLAFAGLLMLNQKRDEVWGIVWLRVIALEVAAFAFLVLRALSGGVSPDFAEQGLYGGKVGYGLAVLMTLVFGTSHFSVLLQRIVIVLIFVVGTLYGLNLHSRLWTLLEKIIRRESARRVVVDSSPAVSVSPTLEQEQAGQIDKRARKKPTRLPPEFQKNFRVEEQYEQISESLPRDDRLPPLDLLVAEKSSRPDERHINQTAGLIEKTLSEFGIPAQVIGFKIGPTVTQFAVEPGYKPGPGRQDDVNGFRVRVSQISSLRRDLALALSAERLRIQAPVPGQPYIGIEVPNARSYDVRLRPILETETFHAVNSPLAIALGRDVSGKPVVADLGRMPHILIAGTTGSGKSVCIAAVTICLVMNNTPEDLRLVMIDPKKVELIPFNGLPHLIGKVETDLDRIAAVLRWVVVEMEERYKKLEELSARDIEGYNRKARRRKDYKPLPRIIVLVDELADLMMSAAEQTEATLVRLAQMARATGIHLVVATQRPSTEVVTGLIKANFPARLSFAVASGVDSRVIIDGGGAETLLGRGDMLFSPPEVAAPIRSQGVMVTDQEVERVINFWRDAWIEDSEQESPWEAMLGREAVLADKDDLIEDAIILIKESGRASASHLQRNLRIGYPRAARLIDDLEDLGIVGPSQGGGRDREILIDIKEEDE
jgi:S-DNA-T family DNA segregation ATPase FtsK/SpoIIIE